MSRRTVALLALLVSVSLPTPSSAQTRTVLVVRWDDPSATEVAAAARGALAGTGAEVVPEAETSAALAFLGNPATLDDEAAERLRGALSARVLYVIAVLPASEASLNVAVRTFDGGAPRSAFGRSTRDELAGYVVGQLLSAPSAPASPSQPPAQASTASLGSAPASPAIAATGVAPDGGLVVGQEVQGNTALGTDSSTPSCHRAAGSPEQTWSFTAPADGTYRFHVDASYDAVLAIHTPDGAELGCNDDYGNRRTSEVAATLVGGRTYAVVVDGFRGQSGAYRLRVDEGAPAASADLGTAAIAFVAVGGFAAMTALLGYYSACDQSPLCAGHPTLSWIPVFGPFIVVATQPLPGWSEFWYPLMGGIQLAFLTFGILAAVIPNRPAIAVDRSAPPAVAVRFDLGPTDGGALALLRGEWR